MENKILALTQNLLVCYPLSVQQYHHTRIHLPSSYGGGVLEDGVGLLYNRDAAVAGVNLCFVGDVVASLRARECV